MTPAVPQSILHTLSHYLATGDDLQRTRRHVVRHHGRAEWRYLTTETGRGTERQTVARWLRRFRAASRANGTVPREAVRLARAIDRA